MYSKLKGNTPEQCAFEQSSTKKLLIPFFTPKHTFLTSTNAILNIITYTHFLHLLIKKPSKNWYSKKQPTNFSMKP